MAFQPWDLVCKKLLDTTSHQKVFQTQDFAQQEIDRAQLHNCSGLAPLTFGQAWLGGNQNIVKEKDPNGFFYNNGEEITLKRNDQQELGLKWRDNFRTWANGTKSIASREDRVCTEQSGHLFRAAAGDFTRGEEGSHYSKKEEITEIVTDRLVDLFHVG